MNVQRDSQNSAERKKGTLPFFCLLSSKLSPNKQQYIKKQPIEDVCFSIKMEISIMSKIKMHDRCFLTIKMFF